MLPVNVQQVKKLRHMMIPKDALEVEINDTFNWTTYYSRWKQFWNAYSSLFDLYGGNCLHTLFTAVVQYGAVITRTVAPFTNMV